MTSKAILNFISKILFHLKKSLIKTKSSHQNVLKIFIFKSYI